MRKAKATPVIAGMLSVLLGVAGCGGDDESATFTPSGKAGTAGSGAAGSSGTASGGSSGRGGSAGSTGGSNGTSGSAGTDGSGGSGATSGGAGGTDGAAGTGAGTGGTAGAATGGSSGSSTGGVGGSTGGTGGTAGTGGTSDASAGSSGTGGAGTGGTDGASGSGTGGSNPDGSTGAGGSSGTGTGGATDGGAGVSGSGTGGSTGSGTGGTSGAGTGGTGGGGTNGASGTGGGGTSGASGTGGSGGSPQCGLDVDCSNGLHCDGVEQCDNGTCITGTPVSCPDDGFSCTSEICDETNDACASVPQDARCSDQQFCNGSESCAPGTQGANANGCVAGTPPTCNDGVSCTDDACDEANRRCDFAPVHSRCTDSLYCNGGETCDPVNGAQGTGCRAGTPIECDDSIACTADSCNESANDCDNVPNNLACTNNLLCDGVEICDPTPSTGGCKPGIPVSCQGDGIVCSVEACNPANGQCETTYDNALCPSGQTCTNAGCVVGPPCSTGANCQDGNACNGTEVCDTSTTPGICRPGPAVNCNDGIDCTLDLCNPTNGACTHPPDASVCSDGDPCTGTETCDPTPGTGGCKGGTPMVCNDGIACTVDQCTFGFGCQYFPEDDVCNDDLVCNGTETCDATPITGGCKPGSALNCVDDGIACTSEVCTEPLGCRSVPDNSRCSCGQTCNATQGGCGNFCSISQCGGKLYQCGDCLDNDADCSIDSADSHCTGVCDNTENHLYPNLPGAPGGPCKLDCFFDNGNGSGNDDCYWDHKCDPLEVAPNYPPEGQSCSYTPGGNVRQGLSCTQAMAQQSAMCTSYCGPLTPNGCDCFGCCAIPGAPTTVWLGSEDGSDNGTCTLGVLNNPALCKPCTQVPACLNTCGHCELCLGKTELPPDCNQQVCPNGTQLCGLPGQAACPSGFFCVTGCCQPLPGGGG